MRPSKARGQLLRPFKDFLLPIKSQTTLSSPAGASFHAGQHGQPGIDVFKAMSMNAGRSALCASDGRRNSRSPRTRLVGLNRLLGEKHGEKRAHLLLLLHWHLQAVLVAIFGEAVGLLDRCPCILDLILRQSAVMDWTLALK